MMTTAHLPAEALEKEPLAVTDILQETAIGTQVYALW